MSNSTVLERLPTPPLVAQMLDRLGPLAPADREAWEREFKLSCYYGGLMVAAEAGPDGGKATGVSFTELSKSAPAQFTVGFDFKQLPRAVQQNFKAPGLQLDPANTDARLVKTWGVGTGPAVPPS